MFTHPDRPKCNPRALKGAGSRPWGPKAFFICAVSPKSKGAVGLPDQRDWAANVVAAKIGIPSTVPRSLALSESGHARKKASRPCLWAVNEDEIFTLLDTAPGAETQFQPGLDRGNPNFANGCLQVNYRRQCQSLQLIEVTPQAKADAQDMTRLHSIHRDRIAVVKLFDGSAPGKAKRNTAKVVLSRTRLGGFQPSQTIPVRTGHTQRRLGFSLLQAANLQPHQGSLAAIPNVFADHASSVRK